MGLLEEKSESDGNMILELVFPLVIKINWPHPNPCLDMYCYCSTLKNLAEGDEHSMDVFSIYQQIRSLV